MAEDIDSHGYRLGRPGLVWGAVVVVLVVVAFASWFVYDARRSRLERMVCTSEAPLKRVKAAQGCFMCGTTVGYTSEVVTYNYEAGGRVYVVGDERENSRRRDDRHYFSKVCFEPSNPRNAYFADAHVKCGAE